MLTYTEQFDNAIWVKQLVTITPNAVTAPDGTLSADLLYPLSTGANRSVYYPGIGGVARPFSVYAKAGGKNFVWLNLDGGTPAAWFDLSTGTIGTIKPGFTASITAVGNGWYRCSAFGVPTIEQIGVSDTDNSQTVTVNGTSGIYIWGAQLELGTSATAYQVNTNSIGGPGNHGLQATAAARPTWTNRVNLLTYTEQFDNAAWTKTGSCSVTPNTAVAPDGTTTADTVTIIDGYGVYQIAVGVPFSTKCTWSIYVKGTPGVIINVGMNAGDVSYQQVVLTASWQRVSGQVLSTASGNGNYFHFRNDYPVPAGQVGTFVVEAWGAQLEVGTTATTYQRVTTATDFDTVGFPYYLSFLGTDDSLTSATGGGGSAGFFWCGVVEPTDGAGTLQTLFADNGTNTGYKVQKDVSNKLSFSAGNNTAFTTKVSTAALSIGTKVMLTAWDDGTNLNVQIGDAAAETVARPVVVAGTAGYTIAKDNGAASSFYIGNKYPGVYAKDTGLTASQRATVQAWVKQKAGL